MSYQMLQYTLVIAQTNFHFLFLLSPRQTLLAVGLYSISKQPMSLGRPHVLENMLEEAKLPVAEVSRAEYPLHLGKDKAFAFKALTLPIRSELQVLKRLTITTVKMQQRHSKMC